MPVSGVTCPVSASLAPPLPTQGPLEIKPTLSFRLLQSDGNMNLTPKGRIRQPPGDHIDTAPSSGPSLLYLWQGDPRRRSTPPVCAPVCFTWI